LVFQRKTAFALAWQAQFLSFKRLRVWQSVLTANQLRLSFRTIPVQQKTTFSAAGHGPQPFAHIADQKQHTEPASGSVNIRQELRFRSY